MNFLDFAHNNGLLIKRFVDDGNIHRCPTQTKPRSLNGAYMCREDFGFVQAWDEHSDALIWHADGTHERVDKNEFKRLMRERAAEEAQKNRLAADEARAIVLRCRYDEHAYLRRKGFPKEAGLIDEKDGRLVVPMRSVSNYQKINSVQWIAGDGRKEFLKGGAAKGSILIVGTGNTQWLCEGYSTALSVRAALASLYQQARVIVCFSAGNLAHVAQLLELTNAPGKRYVFADHDENGVGEQAAKKAELPYVMPPTVGDANDLHQASGIRAVADLMRGAYRMT